MNKLCNTKKYKKLSIALLIAVVIMMFFHMIIIRVTNHTMHTTIGKDEKKATYMDVDFRGDATSTWQKKDFDLDGTKVNLTGTTIDEVLHNNYVLDVSDWSLRIDIQHDCFINQAWTGEVEIHQQVGTDKEKVQRLNLQKYKLEDVKLDYRYDGDLLIPLQKGDYVIYYPNPLCNEDVVESKNQVTVGMIFYYIDELDLSDDTIYYAGILPENSGVD